MKKYELCSECKKKLQDKRILEQGKLLMDIELCDECYKAVHQLVTASILENVCDECYKDDLKAFKEVAK